MYALAALQPVLAHPGPYNGGPGGWWLGGPVMFLIWIAIIFLLFRFVFRGGCRWQHEPRPSDRGRDILAERYARGEIDADEYRERSEMLRSPEASGSSPMSRARDLFDERSARRILAERYARGEIDQEEYRKRSETLR